MLNNHHKSFILKLVASQVDDLRDRDDDLPEILVPECPYSAIYNKKISNYDKVAKIQQFINELQYNHTGLRSTIII
jgi:hypothetical protein